MKNMTAIEWVAILMVLICIGYGIAMMSCSGMIESTVKVETEPKETFPCKCVEEWQRVYCECPRGTIFCQKYGGNAVSCVVMPDKQPKPSEKTAT